MRNIFSWTFIKLLNFLIIFKPLNISENKKRPFLDIATFYHDFSKILQKILIQRFWENEFRGSESRVC